MAIGGKLTFDEPAPGRDSGRIYYYVPDGIDLSRPAPLLVFLHGGGVASTDATAGSYFSEERRTLMPDVANAPFIVAAPSAPVTGDSSRWNHAGTSRLIDDTIAAASKKFRVDRDDLEKPFTVDMGQDVIRTVAAEPVSGDDDYSARLSVVAKEAL